MVTGPSKSYLWILCRDKSLDKKILSDLVTKAQNWGFETSNLIYVDQQ
jgi:apolipoprotein D and lipocalin family protein